MAISLKHSFTSSVPDDGDTSLVRPSNWNAEHTLTAATDTVLGRSSVGTGAVEEIPVTAAGRAILDDVDAAAQRTTLGLGTIATQAANNVNITGGSISGITDLAVADGGTGAASFTAYSVILGGTTSTGPFQNVSGLGTSGQILTSAGAGAIPIWATPSGGVTRGQIEQQRLGAFT